MPQPQLTRHQAALFAATDRAGLAADRAVAGVWRELLAAIRHAHRERTGPGELHHAAAQILRRLPLVIHGELTRQFLGLFRRGHRTAQVVVRSNRRRKRVTEAIEFGPRGALSFAPEPDDDLFDLLLPPPPETQILAWLQRFVRPSDWERIGTPSDRRLPEDLADRLAVDYAAGLTPQETSRNLLPYLEGSRVRARRAARTFGLHVAHSAEQHAWDQLGDLIVGYQVHATLDEHTRPEHRRRDGTIYYKRPGPGQPGLGRMPRPPVEADGSISWNCRCFLTPVLLPLSSPPGDSGLY